MTSRDHEFGTMNLVQNQPIGKRPYDPLPQLLAQILDRAGDGTTIQRAVSRPWASALFEGRRHIVSLQMAGADTAQRMARFTSGLDTVEWALPGHFVADICVDDSRQEAGIHHLELSALTIEDW